MLERLHSNRVKISFAVVTAFILLIVLLVSIEVSMSSSTTFVTEIKNNNFRFLNGFAPTIVTTSPFSLTVDHFTGNVYGLFSVNRSIYLESSTNFVDWAIINRDFLPKGYGLRYGKDLAVVNSGAIIVSATGQINGQNFTIFEASWNNGQTFSTVLNVSLISTCVPREGGTSKFCTGPGNGFWHGVTETSNGTLFAGLYDPQGLIYSSSDDAHTWSLVFNASATGFGLENEIHDVEVNPYTNYVYVITDDEAGAINNRTIWMSTNYGNNWQLLWAQDKRPSGSGLPSQYIPLTFGFLQNGTIAALGLDNDNMTYVYLFHVNPDGTLSEYERLNASSSYTDPFITNWILSVNSTALLLSTTDSIQSVNSSALGAGLLFASSSGTITPLAIVQNVNSGNPGGLGFIDVLGPSLNGNYGAIARTESGLMLLAFNANW
jgi:hypothetical protein